MILVDHHPGHWPVQGFKPATTFGTPQPAAGGGLFGSPLPGTSTFGAFGATTPATPAFGGFGTPAGEVDSSPLAWQH
jgi:hypothetical protein